MSRTDIEKWKIRQFVKTLSEYRGISPTGMITLPIPPGTQIGLVMDTLRSEYSTSSNIKSHSTVLAVQSAITAAIQKLKLYSKIPENGLIIYSGNACLDGKEKKVSIAIDPIKPVTRKNYYCSNKFDVSLLEEMLEDSLVYGFIIMDGNGCLFGKIQGSKKTILGNKTVELPKKHRMGGQSSQRFQRKRLEARDAYTKIACEMSIDYFIEDNKPNISALIIAGNSEFKTKLITSDIFDQRLKDIIFKVIDISYGGEHGFEQALDIVKPCLDGLPLLHEKEILSDFFKIISLKNVNGSKVSIGLEETIAALEDNVIKRIIIYENSNIMYKDQLLIEYLVDNYEKIGFEVSFISDNTGEGIQFIKGLSGIGAILKYDWIYYKPEEIKAPEEIKEDVVLKESLDLEDFFM